MNEFYEMIKEYQSVAKRLDERRKQLAEEIKTECDLDRLRLLEQRMALIETEKYEVTEDLKALKAYVRERENAKKKSIA